ncbi:LOW QUALITY PROTEIN: Serine/threonine protein kinase, partial [Phytophthora megakarya]
MHAALLGEEKKKTGWLRTFVGWIRHPFQECRGEQVQASIVSERQHYVYGESVLIDVNQRDSHKQTELMKVAREGNLAAIRTLIEAGADIHAIDEKRRTALIHATENGNNLHLIQFLVECGANVNSVDDTKRTALVYALESRHLDVARLLVQNGADIDTTEENGQTSLMLAVKKNDMDAVRFLVQNNASINDVDKNGMTSLMYATQSGNLNMVRDLLNSGADASSANSYGVTAVHIATTMEYSDIRRLLMGSRVLARTQDLGADRLVKLADFQVSGSTTTRIPGVQTDVNLGSFRWQAPERLWGEKASIASDLYSFGLCAIAAVTGITPWGDCWDDEALVSKGEWDAVDYPNGYDGPVPNGLTFELEMLVSRTCSKDPHSRISAAAVVQELKHFAAQESIKLQQSESKAKSAPSAHISEYRHDDLTSQWQKLQDIASTIRAGKPELAVVRELETLYERFATNHRPEVVDRFHKLITDCISAIDVSSHQYRILRLSSTKAQGRSMTGIYRRIDALWDAIGDVHSDERNQRREEQKLQQREAFISELSQTIVVLGELETDEARNTFVAFLKTEIDSHGSTYTEAQLTILEKAYTDLNASRQSDIQLCQSGFFHGTSWSLKDQTISQRVYRAKWLESEVIVKKIKLTSSKVSNSVVAHSLSATFSTFPPDSQAYVHAHNVEKERKEKREMFEHEVDVWFSLSHPHVVRLLGACHIGPPLFACEYASNGSLDKYLRKQPNQIWQKLHEAALGVQYLHSRNIIHCDLKCNNIVVGGDNKAKVTDFGLSSANIITAAWHGWRRKRGPSELSTASDIYALGMCIVEALRIVEMTRNNAPRPWGNLANSTVKYHVSRGTLPSRPKLCTDDAWELVTRMCVYNPKDRIKISTVVDKLASLAGVDKTQCLELTELESVIFSQEGVETMKTLCCLEKQDEREACSTNQVVLCSVYGLLWDRFEDICSIPSTEIGYLQPLFDRAWISTQKLEHCPNTLTGFTEMAMN